MKNFVKVFAIIIMAIIIMLMLMSCGEAKTKTNGNFDYILEYFQDSIATKEQQLIHCDITNNEDGYLLTYSYTENDIMYVAIIVFNEECEITRYDIYGEGQYVDKTDK